MYSYVTNHAGCRYGTVRIYIRNILYSHSRIECDMYSGDGDGGARSACNTTSKGIKMCIKSFHDIGPIHNHPTYMYTSRPYMYYVCNV